MSRSRLLGVLVLMILTLVSACGGEASVDETTTTEPAPTTTEPAPTTTQTEPAPTTTEPAPTTTQTQDVEANRVAWAMTASDHRGEVGTQYDYECPAPGSLNTVWGTEIYTDDSSVCSAAVHAGLITLEDGGTVTIEMRPGEASYTSTAANGVTSAEWGVWSTSYVFVG